jgi:hypothetical protein
MGAYGWAKLKIGGRVSKRALREALAIHEIDLDEALEPGDYEGHGLAAYLDEDHLVVKDDQASYAQFTDLEDALVTAGIAFDRLSDPVAEFGECVSHFRPGMAASYDAASEGYEPMVSVRPRGAPAVRGWPRSAPGVAGPQSPSDPGARETGDRRRRTRQRRLSGKATSLLRSRRR